MLMAITTSHGCFVSHIAHHSQPLLSPVLMEALGGKYYYLYLNDFGEGE
jgi:hypothetical protein